MIQNLKISEARSVTVVCRETKIFGLASRASFFIQPSEANLTCSFTLHTALSTTKYLPTASRRSIPLLDICHMHTNFRIEWQSSTQVPRIVNTRGGYFVCYVCIIKRSDFLSYLMKKLFRIIITSDFKGWTWWGLGVNRTDEAKPYIYINLQICTLYHYMQGVTLEILIQY